MRPGGGGSSNSKNPNREGRFEAKIGCWYCGKRGQYRHTCYTRMWFEQKEQCNRKKAANPNPKPTPKPAANPAPSPKPTLKGPLQRNQYRWYARSPPPPTTTARA